MLKKYSLELTIYLSLEYPTHCTDFKYREYLTLMHLAWNYLLFSNPCDNQMLVKTSWNDNKNIIVFSIYSLVNVWHFQIS